MPEQDTPDSSRGPLVSIIIANYNGERLLGPCLESLQRLNYPQSLLEVLVVDNGSSDGSAQLVQKQFPHVHWIEHSPNHYARALNIGISLSRGEQVAFLNNDTVVGRQWLVELVGAMKRDPRIGACGSKILLMDGRINSTGHRPLPEFYWADRGVGEPDLGQYDQFEAAESLTGCALLVRREALGQAGLFDEDFVMYMEDVDLSLRLRQQGWKLAYVPGSVVRHVLHGTPNEFNSEYWTERNRLLFIAKHYPGKLAEALFGRGYWAYPRQVQPGALLQVMPSVVNKLLKHHGPDRANPLISGIFDQLRCVQNFEWDAWSQQYASERRALQQQVSSLQEQLQRGSDAQKRLAAEISRIYDSRTYRYFARPLWRLLKAVKRLVKSVWCPKKPVSNAPMPLITLQEGAKVEGAVFAGCTIISKNYLAYARALCRSFLEHHPGSKFFVLLVDRVDGHFNPADEPFELVQLESLNIPDLKRFCFQYSIVELNTAVKPYFLEYLFRRQGTARLIFLDPDILVLRPLSRIFSLLDKCWMVLTPHITEPLDEDGHKPDEISILNAGTQNLGFIALRRSETAQAFLKWWQQRLYSKCEMAPDRGMHVDQKWIDLVPSYFDGVYILREPGFNVAYWNLSKRPLTFSGHEVFAAGEPCYFVHFSGFQPEHPEGVSKHQDRLSLDRLGDGRLLFERYQSLLQENNHDRSKRWPYAFGQFNNGVRIPDAARKLYLAFGDPVRKFGDPFDASGSASFFYWLNRPIDDQAVPERVITRLWEEIYRERPDVQEACPDFRATHRTAFLEWAINSGRFEHAVDDALVPQSAKWASSIRLHSPGNRFIARCFEKYEPWVKPLVERLLRRYSFVWNRLKAYRYKLIAAPSVQSTVSRGKLQESPRLFGVNASGYIQSEKGMGEVIRSTARALQAVNVPCTLNNFVDSWSSNRDDSLGSWTKDNPYAVNLIHVNADQVPMFAKSLGDAYFQGRYNIGCWLWELTRFPQPWLRSFDYLDEVWVPSRYVADILAPLSPIPITVMPLSLDLSGNGEPIGEVNGVVRREGCFRFLFIFDFMSHWQRKNPFGLVEVFRRAFGDDKNFELVIKTMHTDFSAPAMRDLKKASKGAQIQIIDGVWKRHEIKKLLSSCDCYVSLHRSEGFGLTMAEAMVLGKPVIATNYSANRDFMSKENSLLVDFKLIELAENCGPYERGGQWAEPNLDHAVHWMRWVVTHPDQARAIGMRGQKTIHEELSPLVVGQRMKSRLEAVLKGGPKRVQPVSVAEAELMLDAASY